MITGYQNLSDQLFARRAAIEAANSRTLRDKITPFADRVIREEIRRAVSPTTAAALERKLRVAYIEARRRVQIDIRHPAAELIDTGGTVRPSKAGALAIPLQPALTKDSGPRRYRNLELIPLQNGHALLVHPRHGPLFVLVQSATIAPHPYLLRTLERVEAEAILAIAETVADVLEGEA